MEVGSAALHILVDSWEGHLTPLETATLADRASRGRDSTTVQKAAELALSVLPHAHALNPNEISRALLQCKEQVLWDVAICFFYSCCNPEKLLRFFVFASWCLASEVSILSMGLGVLRIFSQGVCQKIVELYFSSSRN